MTCSQRHPVGADRMSLPREGSHAFCLEDEGERWIVVTLSPLNNSGSSNYMHVGNVRKANIQNLVDEVIGTSS